MVRASLRARCVSTTGRIVFASVAGVLLGTMAQAASLTRGNVLFVYGDSLREFTLEGQQVQTIFVPPGGPLEHGREVVRSTAVDDRGRIHVYNGTFRPWISSCDPATGQWTHRTVPGLSTAGAVSGGGLCLFRNSVFVTDVGNSGAEARGLVRVSLDDGSHVRFDSTRAYDDVVMGPDDTVYALDHNQGQVRLFDPVSLAQVGFIQLPAFCSSIVVAPGGDLFGTGYAGGGIRHIAADGTLVGQVGTGNCAMTSVDRLEDGTIIATGFCGRVFVTDESLRTPSMFRADDYGGFVTAIPLSLGNHAPDCAAATADAGDVWPPNHQMVPVQISGIVDPDGDDITIAVRDITQDEPLAGAGGGDGCPDATIDEQGVAWVRVERAGRGDGRVYRLTFDAMDSFGATCSGSVGVCIPRDQSRSAPRGRMTAGSSCEDDGPQYRSTGPCPTSGPRIRTLPTLDVLGSREPILSYEVPADGAVDLTIFDVAGRRIITRASGSQAAGRYSVALGPSIRPGVYFSRLRTPGITTTRMVIKTR